MLLFSTLLVLYVACGLGGSQTSTTESSPPSVTVEPEAVAVASEGDVGSEGGVEGTIGEGGVDGEGEGELTLLERLLLNFVRKMLSKPRPRPCPFPGHPSCDEGVPEGEDQGGEVPDRRPGWRPRPCPFPGHPSCDEMAPEGENQGGEGPNRRPEWRPRPCPFPGHPSFNMTPEGEGQEGEGPDIRPGWRPRPWNGGQQRPGISGDNEVVESVTQETV